MVVPDASDFFTLLGILLTVSKRLSSDAFFWETFALLLFDCLALLLLFLTTRIGAGGTITFGESIGDDAEALGAAVLGAMGTLTVGETIGDDAEDLGAAVLGAMGTLTVGETIGDDAEALGAAVLGAMGTVTVGETIGEDADDLGAADLGATGASVVGAGVTGPCDAISVLGVVLKRFKISRLCLHGVISRCVRDKLFRS